MKNLKYAVIGTSLLATILALSYGLLGLGGQGIFVFVCCLVPGLLGAYGTLIQSTLPRWGAIVSTISFLLVAMKTSGGPEGSPLQNIMMAGALGLLLSLVLAIKPEKA